jgi:hypothetical protein
MMMANPYMKKFCNAGTAKDGKQYYHDHDVYDVLKAFGVTCPAVAHAVKKLLCAGQRGHKTAVQDLQEAVYAINRAIEMANK